MRFRVVLRRHHGVGKNLGNYWKHYFLATVEIKLTCVLLASSQKPLKLLENVVLWDPGQGKYRGAIHSGSPETFENYWKTNVSCMPGEYCFPTTSRKPLNNNWKTKGCWRLPKRNDLPDLQLRLRRVDLSPCYMKRFLSRGETNYLDQTPK